MLSVPSTPAQGATAPTAVEKAERRVVQQEKDALQQEQEELQNKISLLKKYCSRRITDSERAEVAKELWDAFEIDVKDVAKAKAELEDLKKNLTSVNTQLETVWSAYADLVAMQRAAQVPQVCYVCVWQRR